MLELVKGHPSAKTIDTGVFIVLARIWLNCCRETTKMGVPPGNRRVLVPRRTCVAGADIRGRQGGWPYPWSQQVIHEISGLKQACWRLSISGEPFIKIFDTALSFVSK